MHRTGCRRAAVDMQHAAARQQTVGSRQRADLLPVDISRRGRCHRPPV